MAWRIEESVRRGEIDARERGVVRGRLWLHGTDEPVILELWGNACPDLAGCCLEFDNRSETIPMPPGEPFSFLQHGVPGDMTACRKIRVSTTLRPTDQSHSALKDPFTPQTLTNGLFLEWFSEANGRVVLESIAFKLTLSLPSWRLTSAEEFQRQRESTDAFAMFLNRLSQAVEAARHQPPPNKKWDEFDYEKMMRESDARRDKYMELADKYHDHPDQDRIIARMMGWQCKDQANGASYSKFGAPAEPEEEAEGLFDAENTQDCTALDPDLTTEGIDWVRDENGAINHPLAIRALKNAILLWQRCQTSGLQLSIDPDLARLIGEQRLISAKLACALDELAYGRTKGDPAFVVARLKRVLPHIHAAQAALERTVPRHLLPEPIIEFARSELFAIREEVLRLMTEFRA